MTTRRDMLIEDFKTMVLAVIELRFLLDDIINEYDEFVRLNESACSDDLYSTTPELEEAIERARKTLAEKEGPASPT